jgi:hypothetical protein
MPASTLTRRQSPVRFTANSTEIVQLSKTNIYRDIPIRLTGQLTLTAVNNIRANFLRGDEWAVVKKIRILANSSDVLLELSGDDLWKLNRDFMGNNPNVSVTFGDLFTANPSFDSILVIPFWALRNAKSVDGSFDAGGLRDFRMEITWGIFTDIIAAATAFTSAPAIEVESYEAEDSPDFAPLYVPRLVRTSKVYAAAVAADRFQLDVGPTYRGFLISVLNNASVETPGILTNIKLVSGSRIFREYTDQMLYQYGTFRHDVCLQQFPLPNITGGTMGAKLVHAFGAADGTIVDVGAAFAQGTLNDNFKELSTKVNSLYDFFAGGFFQGNTRISPQSNSRAVYPLNLCPDGFMSEGIATRNFDEFYLEIATNAAAVVEVISLQMLPPGSIAGQRQRAAA